jgi:hypothetical protein
MSTPGIATSAARALARGGASRLTCRSGSSFRCGRRFRTLNQTSKPSRRPAIDPCRVDVKGAEMQASRAIFFPLLLLRPAPRADDLRYLSIHPAQRHRVLTSRLLPGVIIQSCPRRLFSSRRRTAVPDRLRQSARAPVADRRIRSMIPDRNGAQLVPYNTTYLERDLALRLGIRCTARTSSFHSEQDRITRLFAGRAFPIPGLWRHSIHPGRAVAAICECAGESPTSHRCS